MAKAVKPQLTYLTESKSNINGEELPSIAYTINRGRNGKERNNKATSPTREDTPRLQPD